MPIARHPAGTSEGGRFKPAPAPDAPARGGGLSLTAEQPPGVVDRIRDLGVQVRWERNIKGRPAFTEPTSPTTGPLAGMEVKAWLASTPSLVLAVVNIHHRRLYRIVVAPEAGGWLTDEEAMEAVTGLMHGENADLRWSPAIANPRRWLPMSQLAGRLGDCLPYYSGAELL